MYNPVRTLLAAVFPDFEVSDTHADAYLDARQISLFSGLVFKTSTPFTSIR